MITFPIGDNVYIPKNNGIMEFPEVENPRPGKLLVVWEDMSGKTQHEGFENSSDAFRFFTNIFNAGEYFNPRIDGVGQSQCKVVIGQMTPITSSQAEKMVGDLKADICWNERAALCQSMKLGYEVQTCGKRGLLSITRTRRSGWP